MYQVYMYILLTLDRNILRANAATAFLTKLLYKLILITSISYLTNTRVHVKYTLNS